MIWSATDLIQKNIIPVLIIGASISAATDAMVIFQAVFVYCLLMLVLIIFYLFGMKYIDYLIPSLFLRKVTEKQKGYK
jgi:hypothetical protein